MSVFLLSDETCLSSPTDQDLAAALSRSGRRVVAQSCDLSLSSAAAFGHALATRWQDERPDIAVAHGWLAGLAAQIAGRDTGVPVISRIGALTNPQRDPGRARLEAAIARGSDLAVAGSSDQAEELAARGVPRKQIRLIPLGVDTTRYTDAGPAWSRDDRRRLIADDDLSSTDALGALIAALPTLPSCELLVISPPLANLAEHRVARDLVAAAHQRQVADRLRFVGPVEEAGLPPLLRSADVAVEAGEDSHDSSFVLRAMACGVPVVAYDAGAISDAVADGVTGLLVPPGSPSRLGDAVRSLLCDGLALDSYGLSATDRARARFAWDVIAEATARAIEDVLATRWGSAAAS